MKVFAYRQSNVEAIYRSIYPYFSHISICSSVRYFDFFFSIGCLNLSYYMEWAKQNVNKNFLCPIFGYIVKSSNVKSYVTKTLGPFYQLLQSNPGLLDLLIYGYKFTSDKARLEWFDNNETTFKNLGYKQSEIENVILQLPDFDDIKDLNESMKTNILIPTISKDLFLDPVPLYDHVIIKDVLPNLNLFDYSIQFTPYINYYKLKCKLIIVYICKYTQIFPFVFVNIYKYIRTHFIR